MTRSSSPLAASSRKKGFTLTEIAIVLGIIGLILGAIWVAASSVFSNQKVGRASTQLLTVAQSVRALYATSATTGSSDGADLTVSLCNAGAFPSDTVASCTTAAANVTNPWNGATTVTSTSESAANTGDAFMVRLTRVPTAGCISFITSVGGLNHEGGLIYIGVPAYTVGTATTFPVSVTTASGTAQCGAGATNTITAVFRLRG